MNTLNDKDQQGQDGDIDYLLKSDILEPFPFQTGVIKSLNVPLTNVFDYKNELKKPVKRRTWKKPKGKPKRPLSAYNLFFQHERENLIKSLSQKENQEDNDSMMVGENTKEARRRHRKTHGKIGFAQLARDISQKWKTLDAEALKGFEEKASAEKKRYKKELEGWRKKTKNEKKVEKDKTKSSAQTVPNMPVGDDVLSILGNSSTFDFGTSLKSQNYEPALTHALSNNGTASTIPDMPTSFARAPVNQADLFARISNLHARRLETRREHRRMLDLTYSLCQPPNKSSPTTTQQEPVPPTNGSETESSENDNVLSVKEEKEEFDLFTDTIFESLDPEEMEI